MLAGEDCDVSPLRIRFDGDGPRFGVARDFLRGKSFEEQRQFGINELRKIGVIY